MQKLVVFGAGGRLGRLVVAEARARGHEVVAVVRDPAAHPDLADSGSRAGGSGSGAGGRSGAGGAGGSTGAGRDGGAGDAGHAGRLTVVRADAGDRDAVAAAAEGAAVAISVVPPPLVDPAPDSLAQLHRALLAGLEAAGVERLLAVGMAGTLEVEEGVRLLDTPDYKPEWLPFSRAHAAGLDVLLASEGAVDWLAVSPPMVLDPDAPRSGAHRVEETVSLPPDGGGRASYADLAAALLDEIEHPAHHRTRVLVTA